MGPGASDTDLVLAARDGSRAAFRALEARHQQALRSFLRRACADASDADDLAQETFLAAWSGLWRYDGRSSVRTWLFAIAWNKCLSFMRSRRRASRREAEPEIGEPACGAPDARIDVTAALLTLPLDQRAAVALCLAADFSHAEAADALGLPLGTIKSHVRRGRAKLAALLGGQV
ncbi:MAG TPA: RNA polymerase sigma factor [Caulobacteraceae bacterium]|nr:RNA polymerase sigma factor [Caulobacteraceae bacterium]